MKKFTLITLLILALTITILPTASGEANLDIPQTVADYAGVANFDIEDFCVITTKTVGEETTVTLSKEVDSIQAGWMGYGEEAEDLIIEDLTTSVQLSDHNYQLGAVWTNAYWTPFTWENNHDEYFSFDDSIDEINRKINSVREYMNSGEYQKSAEAQELLSFAKDVKEDVEVEMPIYSIYTLDELQRINVFKDADGKTVTEKEVYYERNDLEIFEYGTDMETIQAAYEEWVNDYPEMEIFMDEFDGHAWGRLIGRDYFGSSGAPNYAYITKQGAYKVVYARNGEIRYFEKTIPAADLFGIGPGKVTFVYAKNNAGWYPSKVRMEFDFGDYKAVTASYDGNGRLYGVGVKRPE